MYLGIDIGGTKTLVASLDDWGVIQEEHRFPTPQRYEDFLGELAKNVAFLSTKDFKACGIGAPGILTHPGGIGLAFGHRPWKNVPIQHDIEAIAHCPTVIENDAKLAGLSEAMLVKQHSRVLYVTVSTGIGTAYIVDQAIETALRNSEGGNLLLEHHGKFQRWEDFASGSAIVKRFGKQVSEIDDEATLRTIARDIAIGLIDLIAVLTPDIVILGGSVGTYFSKYGDYLREYLQQYDNPMIKMPVIKAAERPEKAVIYGCYDQAKHVYG